MTMSAFLYRLSLRIYPRQFVLRYEQELCQVFGDLARDAYRAQGPIGLLRLWLVTLPDLIASAFSEHMKTPPDPGRLFRIQWIVATALGVALGIIAWYGSAGLFTHLGIRPFRMSVDLRITIGVMMGAGVGLMQARVLGRRVSACRWVAASAAGGTAGAVFLILLTRNLGSAGTVGSLVFLCVAMAGSGAILGLSQWLMLRRFSPLAWLWIPCNAFGALAGLMMSTMRTHAAMSTTASPDFLLIVIAMSLMGGSVHGLMTAGLIDLILRHSPAPGVAR